MDVGKFVNQRVLVLFSLPGKLVVKYLPDLPATGLMQNSLNFFTENENHLIDLDEGKGRGQYDSRI